MKVFVFVCDIIIPAILWGIGLLWKKYPPQTINPVYGYRTARACKNQQTWEFAHAKSGAFCRRWCGVALALSAAAGLIGCFLTEDQAAVICVTLVVAQTILPFVMLFRVERALRDAFDKNGHPIADQSGNHTK